MNPETQRIAIAEACTKDSIRLYRCIRATATQCAEAFLRKKGLWNKEIKGS